MQGRDRSRPDSDCTNSKITKSGRRSQYDRYEKIEANQPWWPFSRP